MMKSGTLPIKTINPIGQFIGALIMFGLLGMLPGWILAKILAGAGILRIPREVELAGLDMDTHDQVTADEAAIIAAEREEAARG